MSRWIDADEFAKSVVESGLGAEFINSVTALIIEAPSLDLVRCAECKWYDGTAMSNVRCRCVDKGKHMKGLVENYADDFCSYGERKTDD